MTKKNHFRGFIEKVHEWKSYTTYGPSGVHIEVSLNPEDFMQLDFTRPIFITQEPKKDEPTGWVAPGGDVR